MFREVRHHLIFRVELDGWSLIRELNTVTKFQVAHKANDMTKIAMIYLSQVNKKALLLEMETKLANRD